MISKTATHALRAMVILARQPEDAFAGAGAIATEIEAPQNYLGKLLQNLSREGLVESQKGHGGGFRLARTPDKITLFDVVEAIDQISRRQGCFLGQLLCSPTAACAVHDRWSKVLATYMDFLQQTTIADVIAGRGWHGTSRTSRGKGRRALA
jgi:Rrf2 family protein